MKILKIALIALLLAAAIMTFSNAEAASQPEGKDIKINASGMVKIETGEFISNNFRDGTGSISITATDYGGRVSPLEPHDRLLIDARIEGGNQTYEVTVRQAMIVDPLGRFTTWWGVGTGVDHHGRSGIGTSKIPNIHSDFAAFGVGNVSMGGKVIATGVPVHVMTAESGIPGKLEMDVGDPDMGPIPGLPDGHLRVIWDSYQGEIPKPDVVRETVGFIILLLFLAGALALNLMKK